MMASFRELRGRWWRLAALVAGIVTVGVLVGTLVVPQYFSDAATTTVSKLYTTGTNTADQSTAASSDAPGGARTGTSKPGDTIKWVVDYQNNTGADATVNLKDLISSAGTYVPGSLQVPPNANPYGNLSPQYTTNGGASWLSGNPPSNANGVGFSGTLVPQGTQQKSVYLPSPASQTLSNSGGDGYNAVVSADGLRVYAVFHHLYNDNSEKPVYCAVIATGGICPGWPSNNTFVSATSGTAIGQGTGTTVTGWQNGTWLSGSKLFWLQGSKTAPYTTGIGCLDLSPATPTSCGYSVLGAGAPGTDGGAEIGGTGVAASNGSMYVATFENGSAVLKCVVPTTGAGCGTLTLATGITQNKTITSVTFGSYVFAGFQQTPTSNWKMYCYVAGGSLCSGTWPVTTSANSTPFAPVGMAPLLSTTGAVTGVCTIKNGPSYSTACYNLSGTAVNTAYPSTIVFSGQGYGSGDAYQVGSKVYVSGGGAVQCLDFSQYAGTGTVPLCANFTSPSNPINYTVRSAAAVAPNCLVADGDGRQITFFNAITGGGCVGNTPATSMTVTPLRSYCGSGVAGFRGWGTLTIPGLKTGTYTNSTVTLRDQNNNIISGFNSVTVNAGDSLSLASIQVTAVTSITATVTVNGVNDPSGVVDAQISISWLGDPLQMCFQTTAPPMACDAAPVTLSNTANAVTTSAAGTDFPGGNTTGAAQFTEKPDTSAGSQQCSLVFTKTASSQSARPGDKVTYTIQVLNPGSQAYNDARFSDDLTDVLKDATYNGDASATSGTVSYAAPTLSWSGALAGNGGTATITYSVTVTSPDAGDHSMKNTVVSSSVGDNNCAPASSDTKCTATVTVSVTDVSWQKVDGTAAKNVLEGAEWTFTPVNGSGVATGPAITVTDCVAAAPASCAGADIEPLGGKFRLTNLGPGTYQLVETRAPVGFKLNTTPILVMVPAAGSTVSLADVVNKQLPVPAIPFTGGLGTDTLTITGGSLLVLMLALVGWHLIRRRRTT